MNTPQLPVGMDHPHISIIHPTIFSFSMPVSDMMPPRHLHPLKEGMSMLLLGLRTSIHMKNPTIHISLRILTPQQMISTRYTRPNIAGNPPHLCQAFKRTTPENLPLHQPRNHLLLRNMMVLYMSLLSL